MYKATWQQTNREHRYKYTGDNGEDGRHLERGGDKHKDRWNRSGYDTYRIYVNVAHFPCCCLTWFVLDKMTSRLYVNVTHFPKLGEGISRKSGNPPSRRKSTSWWQKWELWGESHFVKLPLLSWVQEQWWTSWSKWGHDWESHRAVHNWPSVVRVWLV
jgi:hypothetical protein